MQVKHLNVSIIWIIFRQTHLDIERNSYARFQLNSSSGFGGDAIMVKIKDGCRQPYLLMDLCHFQVCTTRPLGEYLGQVLKKSDQWSRRRCDNEIVTVLSNEQLVILKMAGVQPYLLTDLNRFQADTSRHWEEFKCKVSTKFLQWFWRRYDNSENQRWLPVAIFVNGPEPFWGCTTRPLGEHLGQVSKKIWSVISDKMR